MATITFEDRDAQLLNAVQGQIPLVPRPFAALASSLGMSEQSVLERLTALHAGDRAPIRQIGAIFDSKALGYQGTLVAAKIPVDKLDQAAAVINAHPGVSHNYCRDHPYNLWYTLAVAPDSQLGLDTTAAILHRRSGAIATRLMPTLQLYKIGVKLNLQNKEDSPLHLKTPAAVTSQVPLALLTDRDKRLIRVLQQDLPIIDNPFDIWAAKAEVSVHALLEAAEQFRACGIMRRFSAVLRHRELGFDANAMGVWVVPPARQSAFGLKAASFSEVSHCYLRPSYPDWPYTIFTMIHTKDRERATGVLQAISAATGINNYTALYSTHEYKKVRVQYFTGAAQAWEAAVTSGE
jgi:DNA-binding Lrp family transcriptional regulator